MEREIKKSAGLYAVVAIISAILLGAFAYNFRVYQPEAQQLLKTFSSYGELRDFLKANSKTQGTFTFVGPWDLGRELVQVFLEAPSAGPVVKAAGLSPAPTQYFEFQHSITNIQVAGVDEADIVKTDGEHLYLASGHNVFILKAYPPEQAEILSKITWNDTYPVEIFVSPSSDRLAVLGSKYTIQSLVYIGGLYGPLYIDVKTFVNVYDISNKTNPSLSMNFTMSGSYFNSRMIGDYVYFVVSQPAYVIYDTVILPKIYSTDGIKEISASEIRYSNASDDYFMFTTVVALNMQNAAEEPTYTTLLLGGTSSMYVSLNNLYITFSEPDGKTSIYRIHIDRSTITPEAKGKVPGRELNQFSIDEYNNYFRIATTTRLNGNTQNNVYILDMNLNMVGSLENIAPGEAIDSARFIGNRSYLSTSVVRRDPFFVIDVENASDPKILGYLKIPGFTRYLHPYDENHIIGVGINASKVKISLFDVSNVSAPIEMAKYTITGAYSNTPVLTEHKAFLFDRSKDLLAIPASVSHLKETSPQLYEYWQWQGVYVFNITLTHGLVLRGNVTHQDSNIHYWENSYWAKRSLYIENVLYTVSEKKIKMNTLEDLALIKEITLP